MEKEFKLVIVGIFKNEAHIMQEWLKHYLNQGVQHFYLIDNGSTDDWQSEIKGFPVTCVSDSERGAQLKLYNKHFLEIVKENSEWMMVVDLDEFLYARNKFKNIVDYIESLSDNIASVRVPWKMFGSSGYIKQPSNVVSSFTKRQNEIHILCKSITKTNCISEIITHNYDNKSLFCDEKCMMESDNLNLNHYPIQSWEWFSQIKMTRGDVYNTKWDGVRTKKYFEDYDFNEIEDTELKDINKNLS